MADVQLYCGDCASVMAEQIPDGAIDLTVTSPPYDNLRTYNGYDFDFEAIAAQLWRVTKRGGVVVWVVDNSTDKYGSETTTAEEHKIGLRKIGFSIHDTMIYQKTGMSKASTNRYHQVFEYMYVASKGKLKTFNPIIDRKNTYVGTLGGNAVGGKSTRGEYGMRFNVWKYSNGKNHTARWNDEALDHPAPFPEALARDHILSWSNPGDVVLDPMMGSGTTGKMAVLTGRQFIGIDTSDEYVELAQRRIANEQQQLRLPILSDYEPQAEQVEQVSLF